MYADSKPVNQTKPDRMSLRPDWSMCQLVPTRVMYLFLRNIVNLLKRLLD